MPTQVLILTASVGAGHLRAAEAVEEAMRRIAPEATVLNVDILTLTNAAFRRVYGKGYLDLVNKAPHVLGYFYDFLDRPRERGTPDRLVTAVQKLNLRKATALLESRPWDVIVNTHFLPAEIVAGLRRKGRLSVPQITVTTDFETHRLWVHQPCDRYCTATAEGAAYLQSFGVPDTDVVVTGIPIHPDFSVPRSRTAMLKAHDLGGETPIVLQLAGGFGVGPIEKLFRALLDVRRPLEIVTVCGRNEDVAAELRAIEPPGRHRVHVLGFTRKIDELMSVADLLVSKPGGLSSSESLARGTPMAIVNPIPGQESRNSDYLMECGAAIKINNVATMAMKIEKLLADERRMAQLKCNALAAGRPKAAFDVAKLALSLIGHGNG
jgi:processive 1,2-diacylglycerol beta-glucosyltransferase